MQRHMFFSANTPKGFCHFFDNILFLDETQKVIYLKGSSGSGKSTFMRKAGGAFEEKGLDVDYIHCSNNPEDLDGIRIYERGISIIDATYPHNCDPILPKAIDEIFDSAPYLSERGIFEARETLRSLQPRKKQYYDKAYKYLNAAYQVYLNNCYIYSQGLCKEKLEKATGQELKRIGAEKQGERYGRNRKVFADAITPMGTVSHIDSIGEGREVVALCGQYGTGTEEMLDKLQRAANSAGLDTEGFCSVLNPEKLSHLYIPEMNLVYTTVTDEGSLKCNVHRQMMFEDFYDMNFIKTHEYEIECNKELFGELLQQSIDMMASQKEIHDQIESIYVAAMDFERLSAAYQSLLDKLLLINRS